MRRTILLYWGSNAIGQVLGSAGNDQIAGNDDNNFISDGNSTTDTDSISGGGGDDFIYVDDDAGGDTVDPAVLFLLRWPPDSHTPQQEEGSIADSVRFFGTNSLVLGLGLAQLTFLTLWALTGSGPLLVGAVVAGLMLLGVVVFS